MKKIVYLLSFSLLTIIGCKKNKTKYTELDKILITVLQHEKEINNFEKDYKFIISEKLDSLEIYVPSDTEINGTSPPPLRFDIQYISLLLDLKNNISTRIKDSLAILKPIKLNNRIIQLKHNNLSIKMINLDNNTPNNYYSFSIPIYYSDKNFVYIELNNFCQSLCGRGKGILLKKENNNWKIVNSETIWIS